MTDRDIETGEQLMKEEFIMKNPEWMKVLPCTYTHALPCTHAHALPCMHTMLVSLAT